MSAPTSSFDLTGKTVLITGAGGLLGREHAAAVLEIGAAVVLTDIDGNQLASLRDGLAVAYGDDRVTANKMDVTSCEQVEGVMTRLRDAGTRVDVLINNAAIDPKVSATSHLLETSRLESYDLARWDLELSVGLTGAFLCSRTFGGAMAADGRGGVVLNIASDLSVIAPDQRLYRRSDRAEHLQPVKPVSYSVIKAGLVGLTRYLATYWASAGVRANALSPGGVANGQPDEFVQRLSSLVPLGRMAARDEYRGAVQFLCSDASAYLNGQNIVMDGGRSVW